MNVCIYVTPSLCSQPTSTDAPGHCLSERIRLHCAYVHCTLEANDELIVDFSLPLDCSLPMFFAHAIIHLIVIDEALIRKRGLSL
jgi:hypothetical protein